MKIAVCIRQGRDGTINPFNACAYEEALKIPDAEITLVSMGPASTKPFLQSLTRLGAAQAVLLSDKAFAGADTLATAYTLSLYLKKLAPDLVFCGRQTLEGDTAQVPVMLAENLQYGLIMSTIRVLSVENGITCETRDSGVVSAAFPAVVTVERINDLRLPSLLSAMSEVAVLDAAALSADVTRCGLTGSPTRVIQVREHDADKRKCTFITMEELPQAVSEGLRKKKTSFVPTVSQNKLLLLVFAVGAETESFARTVCDDPVRLPKLPCADIVAAIRRQRPDAVLFGSDMYGKRVAATVAAQLNLGLCADCTSLDTDGDTLYMIRPALSGSVIAKIKGLTKPALATVRTESNTVGDVMLCIGYGVKDRISEYQRLAESLGAELAATRKAVDNGLMPYRCQVGLTGKTVSPAVYIAAGVSGAVHHLVGMQRAGTVIAINTDKDAPIFEYADYGILV